ncbi:unnamed protein product [Vicia faba]|uniref:Reverse transcriptase zinc-binding domain-containing protein n=1 Tax=Vicia faba TaxID=3906 RepID=A0AAV1A0L2_VICFA|nr:unnamed protein product [Vicia faba]
MIAELCFKFFDEFFIEGTSETWYSVKDVYTELVRVDDAVEVVRWKRIWKLQVQQRVKSFVCLLAHGRMWTNFQRSIRGLGSAACDICGGVAETDIHLIRDCTKAMEVWCQHVPPLLQQVFFSLNLEDWVDANLSVDSKWI